jgi:hypothetical protein
MQFFNNEPKHSFIFKVKIVWSDRYFRDGLYRFMANPFVITQRSMTRFLKRMPRQDVYDTVGPRLVLHGGIVQGIIVVRFVPADDASVAKTSDQTVAIEYSKKDGPMRIRRCKNGIRPLIVE